MSEVLKPSSEWQKDYPETIIDPDGWDRANFEESWAEPISFKEFESRALLSTVRFWIPSDTDV